MIPLSDLVLIVEDELLIAMALQIQVEDLGLRVCGIAATADQAVAMAEQHRPAIVLMDMRLKGERDGVDAALNIQTAVGSGIIFITGSAEPETIHRIALASPSAVLWKPVSEEQLADAIEMAMAS